jgi:hypothetical protein
MTDEQTELLKQILAELKEIKDAIKSVDNSIAIFSH